MRGKEEVEEREWKGLFGDKTRGKKGGIRDGKRDRDSSVQSLTTTQQQQKHQ